MDSGLHKKAGAVLIDARCGLGCIPVGQAALSPAFGLNARFVIHTVSPNWRGGDFGEVELLKSCYNSALRLALEHGCESVAFPLLSAGNCGFPKELALKTAVDVFSALLLEDDMHIYLVVFGREEPALSEKLFSSVKSCIDENYIEEKRRSEYGYSDRRAIPPDALFGELRKADFDESEVWSNAEPYETETLAAPPDYETDRVCRYIIAAPAPAAQ